MSPFSQGDVVMLRSGSPAMTVSSVTDNAVAVVWYNPVKGGIERETFYKIMLRNATTQPQDPPRIPQTARG